MYNNITIQVIRTQIRLLNTFKKKYVFILNTHLKIMFYKSIYIYHYSREELFLDIIPKVE